MTIDNEELIAFLRENMTIEIERTVSYYSNPSLEVKLKICGQLIDSTECTIYDGDNNGN